MNVLSIFALLSAFLNLAMGGVAFLIAPRSRLNRVFLLETLLAGIWIFYYAFVYTETDVDRLWLYYNISSAGNLLFNPTLLFFIALLIGKPIKKAFMTALPFYAFSVFLTVLLFLGHFYTNRFETTAFGNLSVHNSDSPIYWIFNLSYLMYIGMIVALYRFSAKARTNRLKALSLMLGNLVTAAVVVHLGLNQIIPKLGVPFPLVGDLVATLIFSCGELYAILRYRMLDLKGLAIEDTIVQSLSNAVFVFDPHLNIVKTNPFALTAIGKKATDPLPVLEGLCQEGDEISKTWEFAREKKFPQKNTPCTTSGETLLMDLIPLQDKFGDLAGGLAILHGHGAFEKIVSRFSLTERERNVLVHLLMSGTNKEIAIKLNIAAETVKSHIKNIYAKTGMANRMELMRLLE